MIRRDGAFITYGSEDFTPGHSGYCSYQLGDPAKCPVCKPRPPRRSKRLVCIAGAALAVEACAGTPVVTALPNSCSSLLPQEWRQGVAGAPLPDGDTVGDWISFADQQTGKLDVANDRTKSAIGIVERCEARDAAAVKRATRGFFARLFG